MTVYIIVSEHGYIHVVFSSRYEADSWIREYANRDMRTKYRVVERPMLDSAMSATF